MRHSVLPHSYHVVATCSAKIATSCKTFMINMKTSSVHGLKCLKPNHLILHNTIEKCCISDHFWIPHLQKSHTFWVCHFSFTVRTPEQRPWRWELSRRKALRVPVPPRCSRPDPTTTVDSKGWWEMFQFQCLRFLSCFIVFKRKKTCEL